MTDYWERLNWRDSKEFARLKSTVEKKRPAPWKPREVETRSVDGSRPSREHVAIYALVDPFDETARYIGKTTSPKRRHGQHVEATQRNWKLQDWIKDLDLQHVVPRLQVIEWCRRKDWEARERHWIAWYRARGVIYNIEDGGASPKR